MLGDLVFFLWLSILALGVTIKLEKANKRVGMGGFYICIMLATFLVGVCASSSASSSRSSRARTTW